MNAVISKFRFCCLWLACGFVSNFVFSFFRSGMDRSFDLVALLKQQPTTKSHKIRPTQFVSVAGGVQKRLETNIKNRKSCRLFVFDRIRNISRCESPQAPALSDVQQKALHRKQQLEKWKEEREKKKKEAAALKKKPFVAGMSQRKTFGPPPPARPVPSTSGRVTRSQTRQKIEPKPTTAQTKSFAPSNASFKPPQFLNPKVPTLAPVNKKKFNKTKPINRTTITFEPVLPKTLQKVETRTTRAKTVQSTQTASDHKTRKPNEHTKGKAKNPSQKLAPPQQHIFQSSSSSDMEPTESKRRTKPSQRKSIPMALGSSSSQDSVSSTACVSDSAMSQGSVSSQDELSTPRNRSKVPKSESSSEEKLRSPMNLQTLTPEQFIEEAKTISPCVTKSRGKDNARNLQTALTPELIIEEAKNISPCVTKSLEKDNTRNLQTAMTPEQVMEAKKISPCVTKSLEKDNTRNLQTALTPEQIIEEAKKISPCVTKSRGKDNARKEMKKKLEEGLLDEDNSDMDSVNHFRRQLDSEIARITAMCETWDQVFAQTVLPEPVQELVLTAVGQARLLMSQKMQQFASLVQSCAQPTPGGRLVTPADLHGFWDMVFMQVENVDIRFKKLEELRTRNWVEETKPVAKKVVAKPAAKKVAAKLTGVPSRLREMIAAARKAKKDTESQSDNSESEKSEPASSETKTFEAGFFRISSPVKRGSPAPATPINKSSLLKSVLSSEANKSLNKSSTSFAMLRASLMSKNVAIDGVSPLLQTPTITPVNLYATPARSILKQSNPVSMKKTEKLKTVLFHETDTEVPSSPSYTGCEKSSEPSLVGVVPLPAEDKENKATPRRRSRLSRQNAEEQSSPVKTRSRRKSAQTPLAEPEHNLEPRRRSARKAKDAQETETPKRSTRRRKSAAAV